MASGIADGGGARLVEAIRERVGPRAGAFIVTLYGDVVEPRGGRLSMRNIVETCHGVGISETLVRTAVSRLVSAGQLTGERRGRRSFYGLTEAASREYLSAARTIFEAPAPRWCFAWVGPDRPDQADELARSGFVRIGPQWYLGFSEQDVFPETVRLFECAAIAGGQDLGPLVRAHWNVASLDAVFADFLAVFTPVASAQAREALSDAQALSLRLLLVHLYRSGALRDLRLPPDVLPEARSGHCARSLFAKLYLALSPSADRHVAGHFDSGDGPLPRRTPLVERRLAALARVGCSAG